MNYILCPLEWELESAFELPCNSMLVQTSLNIFFNFNNTVFVMQKASISIVLNQVEDNELGKL